MSENYFDTLRDETAQGISKNRAWLRKAVLPRSGTPYGHIRLSPRKQAAAWNAMTPAERQQEFDTWTHKQRMAQLDTLDRAGGDVDGA